MMRLGQSLPECEIVLVNYDVLIDETHKTQSVKNRNRLRAIRAIADHARASGGRTWLVRGTPIERDPAT